MYHVTTRALDQGGVEPRLAVSLRSEGHRQIPAESAETIQKGKVEPKLAEHNETVHYKKKSTNTSERQIPQDLLWKPPATARNLGPHQRRPYVFLEYPASLIKGEGRKKHTVKLISLLPDMNPMRAAAV